MKKITLFIFILTIVFVNHIFGQSEQAKPKIAAIKKISEKK